MNKEPDTADFWKQAYTKLYADYEKLEEDYRQLEEKHGVLAAEYEEANEIAVRATEHWDERKY